MKIKPLLCLPIFLFPLVVFAQVTISGSVNDARKNPVGGVSVKQNNSNSGTTTDANGHFSFSAPDKTGSLEFSYVGYKTQTVSLKDGIDNITVTLLEDVGKLDEVIVTGLAQYS